MTEQVPARSVRLRRARGKLGSGMSRAGVTTKTLLQVAALPPRRAWTAIRPLLAVISPLGWIVLGSAVAIAVTGYLLGWQEFVYLAITLVAGMIVATGFIFGRSAYTVEIELSPRRVVAGERALGRLLVRNIRPRRSSASRMELPVGAGVADFVIPALEPREEHVELFAVPTTRRAVIVAGPAVSVRGDELGLLRRTVKWAEPIELFVHPVTTPLAPSAAGLVRDLEGEVTKTITNNDISFHALRAYQPGDDRRYVHWRTSARTGQLMVRQFEETRRSQLIIVFVADKAHYESEDEFELAVSVLASLGVQVMRDGTKVAVVSERVELRTRTVTSLLDESCRLEPVSSPYRTTREFARTATLRLPSPSVVMVVSGSRLPIGDFRAVERLFGLDTVTVGFRAEFGAAPQLTSINSLRVATVGALTDLPRLVRRAS
ncbi:DUF58 domain-containing protein [Glaciihabitans tibetensis]|uniref:DUF58 domain-containing protein n=1 Tax=Glaciihabitans tibetensis TaxID=1266600 RepID=UPI0015E64ACF|nr:DUF58 domain-containing protein [Glaciihabitans tibetensis]